VYLVATGTWLKVLVCIVKFFNTERADLFLIIIIDELIL